MPFEIDYEEGNVLNAGLRILHGETPYPVPGSFPYILNPYGPIGYLVSAAGIKIFGLGLVGPRLFVLLAGLGVSGLIAVLTKRLGGRWSTGLLVALSYLCLPLVSYWLPLLRVDFLALFLSLLGLYLFIRVPSAWPAAGLAFGLALLTKQTAVAAPAAVFLELLAERKLARAFGLLGTFVAPFVVCTLALGPNFAFAFFRTHPDPYSFGHALRLGFAAAHSALLILVIIAYAIAFGLKWTSESRLACFYLLFCSVTALSAGKLGSNMNHLLEWTAAICIVGGIALAHLVKQNDGLAKPFAFALVALAVVFAVMSERNFGPLGAGQKGCADLYSFVRSFPGKRVMSDDISALVLAGKPVLVSNPFVITQLGSSVEWQAGSVEQLAQSQYFDLILLGGTVESFVPNSGGHSPELIGAISERYLPSRYFQCEYAKVGYLPKTKSGKNP